MAILQTAPTEVVPDEFPAGLRVLVVDHDITLLKATEQMSARYRYHVTTCSTALAALEILLERKDSFDVILIDDNMPDMDGHKFIQHIHSETINIPVVMMSVSDKPSDVLKAIDNGACHYLIKPLRHEQFKTIWQHVIREKINKKMRNDDVFEFATSGSSSTEKQQFTRNHRKRKRMIRSKWKY